MKKFLKIMKGDEGWWRVDLHPSPSGTPINTGNFKGKMKGEGYLRNPIMNRSYEPSEAHPDIIS